jgi:hypothetical protein
MSLGWCPGLVTREAEFFLHFTLMEIMIEANIALGGPEGKIAILCDRIGEH